MIRMNENTIQGELIRKSMTDIVAREVKREKESNIFQDKLRTMVNTPMDQVMRRHFAEKGIPISNGTLADAMTASLVLQAMNGNIAAYTTIRDTLGYKPVEKVQNDISIEIKMPQAVKELGE